MTDPTATQAQLIKQLCLVLQRQFQSEVELIETHISTILLVDEFAFKIKKPVDFGFLNFTSLDKRAFYCQEELRLNRRLAPHYYLEVDSITGSIDNPKIKSPKNVTDQIIEYMVKMRRFDQHGQLDHLLINNQLNHRHITALAKTIANFHASVEVASKKTHPGLVQSIEHAVIQNFEQITPFLERFNSEIQATFESLLDWSRSSLNRLKPIFQSRLEHGFVRECHGDMHTGNITWVQKGIQKGGPKGDQNRDQNGDQNQDKGQIIIFDAIEFNPDFRWIDVMSEMAFISMDLEYNNRPDLSYQLLNNYLELTGDYQGLEVLRFYQVYRSMVRAKVNCLRLSQLDAQTPAFQSEPDAELESELGAELRRAVDTIYQYIRLAQKFTQTNENFLIITQGVSGSGKSFASRQLLKHYQMIRVRSDVERKRLFAEKQNRYQPEATQKTYDYLHELARKILTYGYPVILDATYLKKSFRKTAKETAGKLHKHFYILSLAHDRAVLEKRIKKRQHDPNNPSEATIEVMHAQLNSLEPLDSEEKQDAVFIDNNETVVETLANHLHKR